MYKFTTPNQISKATSDSHHHMILIFIRRRRRRWWWWRCCSEAMAVFPSLLTAIAAVSESEEPEGDEEAEGGR
jgi:hypothetical protein